MKVIRIDNVEFNATHYAGISEAAFIKEQLPSVQDSYGSVEQKTAFLKIAHAKIQSVAPVAVAEKKAK